MVMTGRILLTIQRRRRPIARLEFQGRIAHTLRRYPYIVAVENGEILERGNHDELVALKGRYYQLYTNMIELA